MDVKSFFENNKTYLEIGPLDKPQLKRPDYNVFYLDCNDTETIKSIYEKMMYANVNKIVDIDYPTYGRSYLESTNGKIFDGVYSSHVIEHTTDLIGHLQDVAGILKEEGQYIIVLPDKSHYADYFRQITTYREIYGAYVKSKAIIAGAVTDAFMNPAYQYDVNDFHNGEISLLRNILDDSRRMDMVKGIYNCSDPAAFSPMCHKWVFTFTSILEIIRDCLRFNLIPFCIEQKECTSNSDNYNIFLVLKKCSSIISDENMRLHEIINLQAYIEKRKGLKSPLNYVLKNLRRKRVFVYGAGRYGKMVYNWLKEEGGDVSLVVSDGEIINDEDGFDVNYISNIEIDADAFFVVAVKSLNYRDEIECVLDKLMLKKWKNYVCV